MAELKDLPAFGPPIVTIGGPSATGRPEFSGPLAATLGDPDAGVVLGVPSDSWPYGGATPAQGAVGPTIDPKLFVGGAAGVAGGCAPPEGWPDYGTVKAVGRRGR